MRSWSPAWITTPTSPPGCWQPRIAGCTVRWVDFHPEDGTLDLEDLQTALAGQAAPGGGGLRLQRAGHDQPGGEAGRRWRMTPGRWSTSTRCSMPRTGRSTCRSWAAISWSARPTSSSARTWACCTGATTCWRACPPTRCARRPTSRPASSRPARRTTRVCRGAGGGGIPGMGRGELSGRITPTKYAGQLQRAPPAPEARPWPPSAPTSMRSAARCWSAGGDARGDHLRPDRPAPLEERVPPFPSP